MITIVDMENFTRYIIGVLNDGFNLNNTLLNGELEFKITPIECDLAVQKAVNYKIGEMSEKLVADLHRSDITFSETNIVYQNLLNYWKGERNQSVIDVLWYDMKNEEEDCRFYRLDPNRQMYVLSKLLNQCITETKYIGSECLDSCEKLKYIDARISNLFRGDRSPTGEEALIMVSEIRTVLHLPDNLDFPKLHKDMTTEY